MHRSRFVSASLLNTIDVTTKSFMHFKVNH